MGVAGTRCPVTCTRRSLWHGPRGERGFSDGEPPRLGGVLDLRTMPSCTTGDAMATDDAMPNTNGASPTALLARMDGYASCLLVLISLGLLVSLVLGKGNPVTAALEMLSVFVSGIVLGIIWIRLTLKRMSTSKEP
jgi:hypothetical protein